MNQRQSAEDGDILSDAEGDVGKRFGRSVGGQTRGRFRGVTNEAGPASEQRDHDGKGRAGMAEHLNGKQRAADRTNNGVDGVPGGIDPRDLVGEKFEEIQNARDGDDDRLAENVERLISRRERDPMEMDRHTGRENRQVKVDASERGESERDTEKIQSIHAETICSRE